MGLPLILWNFPSKVTRILSPQVSPFSLGSTAVLALAGFIPTLLFCPHWDHSSCLGMEEGLPLSAFALGSQELYKFFPVGCNDTFDRESMFCLTQFFVKRSTWAPSWLTCLNCFLSRWFYLMAIRDDLYPPQPPMPSFFLKLNPMLDSTFISWSFRSLRNHNEYLWASWGQFFVPRTLQESMSNYIYWINR